MRRNKKENGTEDRLPITKRALVHSLTILATQQWVVPYTENLTHTTLDRYMTHSLKNTLTGKKKLELKSPQSELIKTAIDGQDAYSRESATHELTEYSANKLLYAASQNAELQKEIDEQLRLGKLDWQTTGSAHVFEEKEVLSQRANITLMSAYGNEPVKLQVYYRQDRLTANAEASRGSTRTDLVVAKIIV